LDCPLYSNVFKVVSMEKKSAKGISYLNVSIR
jgi:hypothetical protein